MKSTFARLQQFILITVLYATGDVAMCAYPETVLGAGPVAYWRFESINDASLVNGYTNTFQNGATVTAIGQGVPLAGITSNRAALFDGADDAVLTTAGQQVTFASNGTMMAWFNLNTLPRSANRVFDLIVKSHFNNPAELQLTEENQIAGFAGTFSRVFAEFNPPLASDTWYHVTFTFSESGQYRRLYLNGVLVADMPHGDLIQGSSDPIVIGNSPIFPDRGFPGKIDEVALFNRALSSEEIQTIFNSAGVSTPIPQPIIRASIDFTKQRAPASSQTPELFGLGLNLSIIPTPYRTTNSLYSPTAKHSVSVGGPNGGTFSGGGFLYLTLAEALSEATNGFWRLVINEGSGSEQTYRFKVAAAGLNTNQFASITVTSPVDGSEGNPSEINFQWTQTQPWLENAVELNGANYARSSVGPGATRWTNAPLLSPGQTEFSLTLRTNAARWITLSTPTNQAGQSVAQWSGEPGLSSRRSIRFRVGTFAPPPPGLQAHLTFDNSNFLAMDESGMENHPSASWFGEPPTFVPNGRVGGAARFTFGGWFEFNDLFSATFGGDFTAAVWIKTDQSFGSDSDDARAGVGIISRDVFSEGNLAVPLALTGNKAAFEVGGPSGSSTLHSASAVNSGEWTHVAVTRNQATGLLRIYVNGSLEASEHGSTNLLDDGEVIRIGAGSSQTYRGLLDEIQMYSAELSAAEIAHLHQNPGSIITNFSSLGEAVDAPSLSWMTGGSAPWFSQTAQSHDGIDAAKSGRLSHAEHSWIETTVQGPGNATFWWRVSSDDNDSYDYLEFKVNGTYVTEISGESDWEFVTFELGDGPQTLRWTYLKDGFLAAGEDAGFLDQFIFTPANLPLITHQPISQTNSPGYRVGLSIETAGDNPSAIQWFKNGAAIPHATNTLFIPTDSGMPAVAGTYYAVASNVSGSTTSRLASVSFVNGPLPPSWSRAFGARFQPTSNQATTNYGIALHVAPSGALYSAHSFTGTNLLNAENFVSGPGRFSTMIVKQTQTGSPIWAVAMTNTGNGNSYPQSVTGAPNDGLYVSGVFLGTNGFGTNRLVETAGATVFLARIDADGSVRWVRTIGGSEVAFQSYQQLAADAAGNVTLSALILNSAHVGGTNLVVEGQKGILVQFDADGNLRWAKTLSGWAQQLVQVNDRLLAVISGNQTNSIGGVTNQSDRKWVLASIDAEDGSAAWLQPFGPDISAASAEVPVLAAAGTNLFVLGRGGNTNASFGSFTLTWPDNNGLYFARFNSDGVPLNAVGFAGGNSTPWSAVADTSGNVFVGGDFDGVLALGGKILAAPHQEGTAPSQTFVAKFDGSGTVLWARSAESPRFASLRDLSVTTNGVWSIGFFKERADYGTNQVFGNFVCNGSPFCTPEFFPSSALALIEDDGLPATAVRLANVSRINAGLSFEIQTEVEVDYVVESRSNLFEGDWTGRANFTGNGAVFRIEVPATHRMEFFRVRSME